MPLSTRKLTSRIGAPAGGADLTAEPDGETSRQLAGDVSHDPRIPETGA